MNRLRIGLVGGCGRMGGELVKLCESSQEFSIGFIFDKNTHPKYPTFSDWSQIKGTKVDVIIDFSLPTVIGSALEYAEKQRIPFVSGTTGINEEIKKNLLKASQNIPIMWAPNMSLGVAVLKEALKSLKAIKEFDFQIEEFHHNKKKDCPSGTALLLQEELLKVVTKKVPEPIGIRGGGIFGVHKVHAMSDEEHLIFEHSVLSRSVFARGALKTAQWILNQSPGLYGMDDVIKR